MLGFIAVCFLFAAYLVTGWALGLLMGESSPLHAPWSDSGPGLRGILIGLAMMPEHFALVPHWSSDGPLPQPAETSSVFRRFSPPTIAFGAASVIGCVQATPVFFLWHFVVPPFGFDFLTVLCGAMTLTLAIGGGVVLAGAVQIAMALLETERDQNAMQKKRSRRRRVRKRIT